MTGFEAEQFGRCAISAIIRKRKIYDRLVWSASGVIEINYSLIVLVRHAAAPAPVINGD